MAARLVISTPNGTVQTPLPPSRVVVGSDQTSSDVCISVAGVAPRHAALTTAAAGVTLEDLGGGVAVNGRPVHQQLLADGDTIRLGAAELRFELDPDPEVRLAKSGRELEGHTLSGIHLAADGAAEARLGQLLRMARTVGADLTYEQVLENLMEILFEALRPERAVLALVDGQGRLTFEAARQADGREPWRELQVSGTILTRVIRSGEAFITADASRAMEHVQSVASKGIRSAMCAPFHLRGQVAGALYADHRGSTSRFVEPDLDFMIMLSHLASVAIQNVVDYRAVEQENERLREQAGGQRAIVGDSEATRQLLATIAKVGQSVLPVLLLGERGTGKELAARAIHQLSGRGPFVPVNCAAIPETLAESALFGHEKGAFTGADRRHTGYFEQADGGTLFLDEIGDLKGTAQAAILRALQEGEIRHAGAVATVTVDVRIWTMFGCTRRAVSRASSRNCSTPSAESARCLRMCLITTRRSKPAGPSCRAR